MTTLPSPQRRGREGGRLPELGELYLGNKVRKFASAEITDAVEDLSVSDIYGLIQWLRHFHPDSQTLSLPQTCRNFCWKMNHFLPYCSGTELILAQPVLGTRISICKINIFVCPLQATTASINLTSTIPLDVLASSKTPKKSEMSSQLALMHAE